MRKAWLTIDDSPSAHTGGLVSFLTTNGIPAILFCRGDRLEENPAPVIDAIGKGLTVANHNYSHRPAGKLSFEEVTAEIEKTESLIDAAYRQTGRARTGKYFRFPYLDKGNGDRLEQRFDEIIAAPETTDLRGDDRVHRLQEYLKAQGYVQPFPGVTHPLYRNPAVAQAADCLFTYSSCDWMLTTRHQGKWPYKTLDDLKRKIDEDPYLCTGDGPQIVLFHDQPEIETVAVSLIEYMMSNGFTFLKEA